MTYEQALKFFKAKPDQYNEIAIKAIEKQIPKKIVLKPKDWGYIRFAEYCPSCGEYSEAAKYYCDNCGQRLDREADYV